MLWGEAELLQKVYSMTQSTLALQTIQTVLNEVRQLGYRFTSKTIKNLLIS